MQKQETVYATNYKGYFQTTRQIHHRSIGLLSSYLVLANDRNVQLSYAKCNELYNGESEFKNLEDDQFFRNSRSLPSKNKMINSQITNASSTFQSTEKRLLDFSSLCRDQRQSKKIVARSYHFSDCMEIIESSNENCKDEQEVGINIYEYEKTKKLAIPEKLEDFQNFKSENVLPLSGPSFINQTSSSLKIITKLKDGAKLESSLHLQDSPSDYKKQQREQYREKGSTMENNTIVHKINIKGPKRQIQMNSKLESIFMTPKCHYPNKQNVKETYTVKLNKDPPRTSEAEQQNQETQSLSEQLQMLRRQLQQKSEQLQKCKRLLNGSESKNKILQHQLEKKYNRIAFPPSNNHSTYVSNVVRYGGDSNYYPQRLGKQLNKQLGGSTCALLYFTLFMVLISQEATRV